MTRFGRRKVDYIDNELWSRDCDYDDQPRSGKMVLLVDVQGELEGPRVYSSTKTNTEALNGWFIGIHSPIPLSKDADRQQRYEALRSHLDKEVAPTDKSYDHWPWWIWVDDKYGNWNAIIPAINEECKQRGDITDYFVEKIGFK